MKTFFFVYCVKKLRCDLKCDLPVFYAQFFISCLFFLANNHPSLHKIYCQYQDDMWPLFTMQCQGHTKKEAENGNYFITTHTTYFNWNRINLYLFKIWHAQNKTQWSAENLFCCISKVGIFYSGMFWNLL